MAPNDATPSAEQRTFAGRESELEKLQQLVEDPAKRVLILRGPAGVGKSALVQTWLARSPLGRLKRNQISSWSFCNEVVEGGPEEALIAWSAGLFLQDILARKFHYHELRQEGDYGRLLADLLIQEDRWLFLDGLETQQTKEGAGEGFGLRHPGLAALIERLINSNEQRGLCIITTQQALRWPPEQTLTHVGELELGPLSSESGRELLRRAGVVGSDQELEEVSTRLEGHPLSLSLLAGYTLARERPNLTDDVLALLGKDYQAVLQALQQALAGTAEEELCLLLGLFDYPIDGRTVDDLVKKAPLPGLRGLLRAKGSGGFSWQRTANQLRKLGLLFPWGPQGGLDAHQSIRAYFGQHAKTLPGGMWEAGHARLFEGFCKRVKEPEGTPETPLSLRDVVLLYCAVRHGCLAGLWDDAFRVYRERIQGDHMRASNLALFAEDLTALRRFAQSPMGPQNRGLRCFWEGVNHWNTGHLQEAVQQFQESALTYQRLPPGRISDPEIYRDSSESYRRAAEACTMMGQLRLAVRVGERSCDLAVQSRDPDAQVRALATLARVYHFQGDFPEGTRLFLESQRLIPDEQRDRFYDFWYCLLLLDLGEFARVLKTAPALLKLAKRKANWWAGLGYAHLILGLAHLHQVLREAGTSRNKRLEYPSAVSRHLDEAVQCMTRARQQPHLPAALLARADLHQLEGNLEAAVQVLDQAGTIARKGSMWPYLADYELAHALVALAREKETEAKAHLQAAGMVIETCGYGRRQAILTLLNDLSPGRLHPSRCSLYSLSCQISLKAQEAEKPPTRQQMADRDSQDRDTRQSRAESDERATRVSTENPLDTSSRVTGFRPALDFAGAARTIREARQWSQDTVSRGLGWSGAAWGAVERGQQQMGPETIERLPQVLDVPMAWLVVLALAEPAAPVDAIGEHVREAKRMVRLRLESPPLVGVESVPGHAGTLASSSVASQEKSPAFDLPWAVATVRETFHLRLSQVAASLGVQPASLGNFEKYRRNLSLEKIERLPAALAVPMHWLAILAIHELGPADDPIAQYIRAASELIKKQLEARVARR